MSTLSGRRAVITGGAAGIGAAIARSFAAEGATVVIADRDGALLERGLEGQLESPAWPDGLDPRAFAVEDAETVFTGTRAAALGGFGNVETVTAYATRLCVTLRNPALLDPAALTDAGARAIGEPSATPIHLLFAPTTIAALRAD